MLTMRPIALTLIAAVLLFQGLEAVAGMLGALGAGNLNINLMLILLFAGVGLLRLSNGWRVFTLIYLGLAGATIAGVAVYEVLRPGVFAVTWSGTLTTGTQRYVIFGVGWLAAVCFIYWAFRTLTRPEIVTLFRSNETPEPMITAATPPAAPETPQP